MNKSLCDACGGGGTCRICDSHGVVDLSNWAEILDWIDECRRDMNRLEMNVAAYMLQHRIVEGDGAKEFISDLQARRVLPSLLWPEPQERGSDGQEPNWESGPGRRHEDVPGADRTVAERTGEDGESGLQYDLEDRGREARYRTRGPGGLIEPPRSPVPGGRRKSDG